MDEFNIINGKYRKEGYRDIDGIYYEKTGTTFYLHRNYKNRWCLSKYTDCDEYNLPFLCQKSTTDYVPRKNKPWFTDITITKSGERKIENIFISREEEVVTRQGVNFPDNDISVREITTGTFPIKGQKPKNITVEYVDQSQTSQIMIYISIAFAFLLIIVLGIIAYQRKKRKTFEEAHTDKNMYYGHDSEAENDTYIRDTNEYYED